MTDSLPISSIPKTPDPQGEMYALLAMVSALTDLSLDMTRLCIEVQGVPGNILSKKVLDMTRLCVDVKAQLTPAFTAAAIAAIAAAAALHADAASANALAAAQLDWIWVRGIALTPDQLEASFPDGVGDDLPWQVVTVGREPGMYASAAHANENISGVPNAIPPQKESTRLEALAFYRRWYESGQVEKWYPIEPDADDAPAADGSLTGSTEPKRT